MGYRRRIRAQGGIGSFLKKAGSAVARIAGGSAVRSLPGAGVVSAAATVIGARSAVQSRPFRAGYNVGKRLTGKAERALGLAPKKKYRKMNATNVRALKRALKRVESFKSLVKRSGLMTRVKKVNPPPKKRR